MNQDNPQRNTLAILLQVLRRKPEKLPMTTQIHPSWAREEPEHPVISKTDLYSS